MSQVKKDFCFMPTFKSWNLHGFNGSTLIVLNYCNTIWIIT